jgi:hypothetical protein
MMSSIRERSSKWTRKRRSELDFGMADYKLRTVDCIRNRCLLIRPYAWRVLDCYEIARRIVTRMGRNPASPTYAGVR